MNLKLKAGIVLLFSPNFTYFLKERRRCTHVHARTLSSVSVPRSSPSRPGLQALWSCWGRPRMWTQSPLTWSPSLHSSIPTCATMTGLHSYCWSCTFDYFLAVGFLSFLTNQRVRVLESPEVLRFGRGSEQSHQEWVKYNILIKLVTNPANRGVIVTQYRL